MLSAKQEEFMQTFKHPYLARVRPRWAVVSGTAPSIAAWQLVPNIPVDPADPNFDEAKLTELGDAAVMHAKSLSIGTSLEIVES